MAQSKWIACQILGYSEQELLATNFQEVTYPDDLGDDLVHIYQLLEGKRRIDQREEALPALGPAIRSGCLQSASVARNAAGNPPPDITNPRHNGTEAR